MAANDQFMWMVFERIRKQRKLLLEEERKDLPSNPLSGLIYELGRGFGYLMSFMFESFTPVPVPHFSSLYFYVQREQMEAEVEDHTAQFVLHKVNKLLTFKHLRELLSDKYGLPADMIKVIVPSKERGSSFSFEDIDQEVLCESGVTDGDIFIISYNEKAL